MGFHNPIALAMAGRRSFLGLGLLLIEALLDIDFLLFFYFSSDWFRNSLTVNPTSALGKIYFQATKKAGGFFATIFGNLTVHASYKCACLYFFEIIVLVVQS